MGGQQGLFQAGFTQAQCVFSFFPFSDIAYDAVEASASFPPSHLHIVADPTDSSVGKNDPVFFAELR